MSDALKSVYNKDGHHYNIYKVEASKGMEVLRDLFPDAEANEMNFVMFSTSGIHGSYATIEDIENGFNEYGVDPQFPGGEPPDDYWGNNLTVLVIHPRIVCMKYGDIEVAPDDIQFLKDLRKSSIEAFTLSQKLVE